jgi:hypothetical protein
MTEDDYLVILSAAKELCISPVILFVILSAAKDLLLTSLGGWPTFSDLPTEAAASFAIFEGCALRLSTVPDFRFSPTTTDQRPTTITLVILSAAKDLLLGLSS